MQLERGGDAGDTQALLEQAWQATSRLQPSRSRALLSVNNAQALQQLADISSNETQLLNDAALRLQAAADTADAVGDRRTASWAYGYLGDLYEQKQHHHTMRRWH